MRVLHTAPTLDISYGGPSTCTYYLVRGLNGICEADLLTLGNRSGEPILWDDTFIKALPNDAFSPILYSRNFGKFLGEHVWEYDVVHANVIWYFFSHQARMAAKKADKPFVLSPHGMLYPNALRGKSAWKKKIIMPLFQRRDLENAAMLHATCHQEMKHLRALGLKQPIAVVPNCLHIDDEYLRSSGEMRGENALRRFGFVGRVNRIKNIDRILMAWKQLGDKTREAELVVIGDGDERYLSELKDYVSCHGLKNVQFLGFLTGAALRNEVHKLDIQILASTSENFGMVVPEALINRVPVIASKGTPWEELPQNDCGWWVENDVKSLAAAMAEALTITESRRVEMGEKGRKLVLDKYTMENVARQMKGVYDYLSGSTGKPSNVYE